MKFHSLTLKDKPIFEKYLRRQYHELSVYAFASIFIWKPMYKIFWAVIEKNLCVFFQDKIGCFMNLEPLGKAKTPALIKKCFKVMDAYNKNPAISRIENIEARSLNFYRRQGYNCLYKTSEYLCLREKIVGLKGDAFKSQRWALNYFIKHYSFEYLPFRNKDKKSCFLLYNDWVKQRQSNARDSLYAAMLEDNLFTQKIALRDYLQLGLSGRVIKVNGKISAYTLGYQLNPDTFCILSETTDLNIKGISQYIFREFSRELTWYKYINIMDDLGLENLAKVKLSYRPIRLITAYNIERHE